MVSVTLLLADARAAGLDVHVQGGRLVIRGPRAADTIARSLLQHKREVLAALAAGEPEVVWRVAAMRTQRLKRGAYPFLIARSVPRGTGGCLSCGAPLAPDANGLAVRCLPCRHAAWLVTHTPDE